MIDTFIVCKICGSKYVVNKKYQLCKKHNYERTHQGKTEFQVKQEKEKVRTGSKFNSRWRRKKDWNSTYSKKKKRPSLISNKNKYKCSNGISVTQTEINFNYRETCNQIQLEREAICQATGRQDLPLSFSHTISRARCKKIGKTELIWDKNNIQVESMGASDSGHYIWEHGSLLEKRKLLNFDLKLEYIKLNDPEGAVRYGD